jgi:hypothetical protein
MFDGTKGRNPAAERGIIARWREGRRRVLKELARKDPGKAPGAGENWPTPWTTAGRRTRRSGSRRRSRARKPSLPRRRRSQRRPRRCSRRGRPGRGHSASSTPTPTGGFQKKGQPFFGYKQVRVGDPQGFVTALTNLPGNVAAFTALEALGDDLAARGLLAPKLAADQTYDGKAIRARLAPRGSAPMGRPVGRRTVSPRGSPTIRSRR